MNREQRRKMYRKFPALKKLIKDESANAVNGLRKIFQENYKKTLGQDDKKNIEGAKNEDGNKREDSFIC